MSTKIFTYQPICSAESCGNPAVFKVAAPWSSGTSRELKAYGLACESHRDSQLARAQIHREGLALSDGETLGSVGLYKLQPECRDAQLIRQPDH